MPPTITTEEIIEKKTGSPIATACLVLSIVGILGAIALQISEIAEYRKGAIAANSPRPGQEKFKKDSESVKTKVAEIIALSAAGADAAVVPDEGKTDDAKDVKATPDTPKEGADTKDDTKAEAATPGAADAAAGADKPDEKDKPEDATPAEPPTDKPEDKAGEK